jgi:hypothetical protein
VRELISQLRDDIIEASSRPGFLHHQWYVKYHLEIVARIAEELSDAHPDANRDFVRALVWIHDYGKTIAFAGQYQLTHIEGRRLLDKIGFPSHFSSRLLEFAGMLDSASEIDLSKAPIEVQIVSSADGCSHFVGPFYYLWWWENSEKPFEELMADNRRKMLKDWRRKIVLPEARAAFQERYRLLVEQTGDIPESFLPGDGAKPQSAA